MNDVLMNRDILFLIFDYLPAESLCCAAKTCRKWNSVYKQNKFRYNFTSGKLLNNKKLCLIKNLDVDKIIVLFHSKLNDNGIIGLCKYNNIKKIDLGHNHGMTFITDKSIIELAKTVEELHLFNCFVITNVGIRSLTKIKALYISGNSNITDEAFQDLRFIEILYINCDSITNNLLEYLVKDNLKILSLPNQITSFKALSSFQPTQRLTTSVETVGLTKLHLSSSNIHDEELKYIRTDNLKELSLTWCTNISDIGIQFLTQGKSIHFDKLGLRCTKVTDVSLMLVSATDLDIWGTIITDEGFLYLENTTKLSIGEMMHISSKCLQYLSNLTYLLAPRTSIDLSDMRNFQKLHQHIKIIPNFISL